jgi:hypothetical protein
MSAFARRFQIDATWPECGLITRMAYSDIAQKPRAARTANPKMKTGLVLNQTRSKTAASSQINTTAIPVRAEMSLVLLFTH